ncbi:MAG: NAD(+)/NADH kinase [Opitutales bacterium]|nr:NAD(+)/NADH kinase [Opitutales bacterium]
MFCAAAIVVNRSKHGALVFAQKLSEEVSKIFRKCSIFDRYPIQSDDLNGYDLCITVGGDGTLLGIAPTLAHKNIPVISINYGSLGFLSSTDTENALDCIKKVQAKQFYISERQLLKAVIGDREVVALNEFVVRNIDCARTVKLQLEYDDTAIAQYVADGLIIASPTGSTAYNSSANGPIVHPSVDALLATPICPHTGPRNTIIFPVHSTIIIRGKSGEFSVYADSNYVENASSITVTTTQSQLKIIQLYQDPFFNTLNKKLRL